MTRSIKIVVLSLLALPISILLSSHVLAQPDDATPVNLAGNIQTVLAGSQGARIKSLCAMTLANGAFAF